MNSSNLKLIKNSGSLSESDLQLLSDTDIIVNMMRNRVLLVANDPKTSIDWDGLTEEVRAFYHIRPVDKSNMVFQIWFESLKDLDKFEKKLMLNKLASA
jgi:hypothetical protein|tara:strand:+ start:12533 stop:12829 length:297 start_codon:yes stop_codon:yes gene_type:complete